MKLIGLMALEDFKKDIREAMKRNHVRIYSEVEITGHTAESLEQFGWWHLEKDLPMYSTLYFAILADDKAEAIMADVEGMAAGSEEEHKPRAFLVNVERMV